VGKSYNQNIHNIAHINLKANKSAMKRLGMACALVGVFIICEVIGGYLSGSLAIMGDAAHMFSDLARYHSYIT
jgi:Co/Zn/Cd efflux system component